MPCCAPVFRRSDAVLAMGSASASDLLSFFKEPEPETRSAVRAADDGQTPEWEGRLHVGSVLVLSLSTRTELLGAQELQTLAQATGCTAQLQMVSCSSSCLMNKYRSVTGVCNNRQHPAWGAANTVYSRWLPAEYEDGFLLPKGWDDAKKHNGFSLPLARTVSTAILYTCNENISLDGRYSHMLVEWGQWIDHDMDLTPQSASTTSFLDGRDCSTSCHNRSPCFPIQIPVGDPRGCGEEQACMPFFRSAPGCSGGLGPREQLNSITSFVDASMVYGSSQPLARSLRNLSSPLGLLATNQDHSDHGRPHLPFIRNRPVNPCAMTKNHSQTRLFPSAGDSRVNEHLGMTVLHTIFLREHNRVASELHRLNPHWSGETLYQESRKIIGAYHQVINWKDYIPKILGPEATEEHLPGYTGYRDTADPRISNVFATAAFRFAHVTIHPVLFRLDQNYSESPDYPSVSLHKSFFSPWRIIQEGGIDPILRGVILKSAKLQTQTQMMPAELTERLFQPEESLALDLASLNLQRGRDHGLPGYGAWRRFCGLQEPRSLSDLELVLNSTYLATKLLSVYQTPGNVDVWIGAIAEPLLPGARVGPLLACLLGRQFRALRDGDRFWWENDGVFTRRQREELRKVTLSRIVCDNTGIGRIPVDVFSLNHYPRDFVPCDSPDLPSLNLSAWREELTGNGTAALPTPTSTTTTGIYTAAFTQGKRVLEHLTARSLTPNWGKVTVGTGKEECLQAFSENGEEGVREGRIWAESSKASRPSG
uniref:Eosinophil peroxidase n=1 Tax=Callorhinchus milii TaxID=7868 RepID=A0A4W3J1T9_CALMI